MEITPKLVKKVFKKLFGSAPDSEELYELLLSYEGNEPERVQMAILKLSGGDQEKLRHDIDVAKTDYRDVLAWAEYPEQIDTGASQFNSEPDVINAIMKRDRAQYLAWLKEHAHGD